MPNSNYRAGRREEYACMERWRTKGYIVTRSAGSHGFWDVCAVKHNRKVELIQCKVVSKESDAARLIKQFTIFTPFTPSENYHLVLEVKVKGSNKIHSITV